MRRGNLALAVVNSRRQRRLENEEYAALLERVTELEDELCVLRPQARSASFLVQEYEKCKADMDRLYRELREEHAVVREMNNVCQEFYRHNDQLHQRLSLFFDCLECLPIPARRQFFAELDKRESECELPPSQTSVCRVSALLAS